MSYEVKVTIDGQTYTGSYVLHAKSITVVSPYGRSTVRLNHHSATTVARNVLEEQVRNLMAKGSKK
jgi:hypothetical protein